MARKRKREAEPETFAARFARMQAEEDDRTFEDVEEVDGAIRRRVRIYKNGKRKILMEKVGNIRI